ncbi:preprotein translocase subunit SecY [Streptococcus suis]|nr:preprotein translocase subunit SecY [Streptococcus suis]
MFFKLLKDALRVKLVRNKILFTIFILFIFRVGTHITVPGVNAKSLEALSNVPFLNMLSLVSGNAMRNFSVFALGVSPYITASIIVQLLQMDILPKFVEWGKQGEVGRRKLNQATRYISFILAFVQSIGITASFNALSGAKLTNMPLDWRAYLLIGSILTTGSVIVTWLGEQISEKGYGNGVSMIIFAGIISSLPTTVHEIYVDRFVNVEAGRVGESIIFVIALAVLVFFVVYFTTFVQQAEYKLPIQYTKRAQGAPSSSYLPLKLNPAGVIPVIFAGSITAVPTSLLQYFASQNKTIGWLTTIQEYFNYSTVKGMIVYAILIIAFTFFYTFVQVNPEKTAESLQKSAAYIHGVRPGNGTEQYLSKILTRLAVIGALFLSFIALLPILAQNIFGLSSNIAFLGTGLIIVISTSIEGIKQLQGYLLKRKYVGFLDITE